MSSSIEQIKDKLPIAEVIGSYVRLEKRGRTLRALCPFHKERTPSFHISPERGTYYCFGCGEKGDVFSFVQKMDGVDFKGALRTLAEKAGVVLEDFQGERGPSKDEKERLFDALEAATAFYVASLHVRLDVKEYLLSRGLSEDTIVKWRIGYAPASWRDTTTHLQGKGIKTNDLVESGISVPSQKGDGTHYDRFRGRIMFPLFEPSGRVVAFSGRFFEAIPGSKEEGEPAKYVNTSETPLFHKSRFLYGFDRAKGVMRKSDFAVLVEGQMDILMMHQTGYPNTVASSGTALTEEHLRTIGNLTKRLVLALDGDGAGLRSALKSSRMALSLGFDVKIAAFPKGKDPADVGKENPEELRRAIREAKTAIEFFLADAHDKSRDERAFRKAAETDVLPLVASVASRIDRAHFIQVVASRLGLPEDAVTAEVARALASEKTPTAAAPDVAPAPLVFKRPIDAAALIVLSNDVGALEKLKTILRPEQYEEAEALAVQDRERLLFMRDTAEGTLGVADLFTILMRQKFQAEIEEVRTALKAAEVKGDTALSSELLKTLQERTRDLHSLSANSVKG